MKLFLHLIRVVLITVVCFSTTNARSQTASTVALAAGAAAVASPVLLELFSGSEVDVDVEVYRETYQLNAVTYTNSPDQYRSEPFRLNGPTVLSRLLTQTNDPTVNPTDTSIGLVANKLGQTLGQLKTTTIGPETLAAKFKAMPVAPGSAQDLLNQEFQSLADGLTNLTGQVDSFIKASSDAFSKGTLTQSQLQTFANQIQAIRLATMTARQDYSANSVNFFLTQLDSIFGDAVSVSTDAKGVKSLATEPLDAPFIAVLTTSGSVQTGKSTISQAVWEAVSRLRDLDANKGMFVANGGSIKTLAPNEVNTLNDRVSSFMQLLGYPPLTDAKKCETESGFDQLVVSSPQSLEYELQQNALANSSIRGATYVGITSSANFGPIANEVMQSIFSQSRMIDVITSGNDRWTRFNYVHSWGGAGNQNVVVYFENPLTPVLKSATFDPSQFLAANAQFYKSAMQTLAQVYGVPMAGGNSNSSLASLNISSPTARKTAADNATAQARQQMLAALKNLLDLHNTLAQSTTTSVAGVRQWKTPTDPMALQNAVNQLKSVSLQLENPQSAQP